VLRNDTDFPLKSGLAIIPVYTTPSDRVTLTSICWMKLSPFPPWQLTMICGSIASPLLWTWTSIFQFSGRVWVGPGVREAVVGVGMGVGGTVVTTVVGVGVTGGVVCVHPAAKMNTKQSTNADAITRVLFIPDNFPGCVFYVSVLTVQNRIPKQFMIMRIFRQLSSLSFLLISRNPLSLLKNNEEKIMRRSVTTASRMPARSRLAGSGSSALS
jgi:hypothetical protein